MAIGRDIIGNLAKQFGYSKELVRDALASNQIDALTASLIGSRIDKLQQTRQEAGARTTVLEDVLAPKPEEMMGQGIAAVPSNLPTEGMAGGGIVAFAEGGETPPVAPSQPAMSIAPPKGYTFDQVTGQYDPVQQSRRAGLGGIADVMFGEESLVQRLLRKVRGYAEGGSTEEEAEEEELQAMEKAGLAQLMGRLSSGARSIIPQGFAIPKSYEAALAEKGQTPASARKLMIEGPKKGDYVMPPLDSEKPGVSGGIQKRGGHKYEDAVIREAERIGLDPNIAVHALYKETGNLRNPETVRSKAGAIGIMQLMPRTAKELGVDPLDPEQNIRGGVMYLKKMMDKYNDPTLALAAYNAGPGRVDRILKSGQGIEALPRETRNYIRMADGGIVAFQEGGISPEFGGYDTAAGIAATRPEIDEYTIDPMTGEKLFSGYRGPRKPKSAPTTPAATETTTQAPTAAPAPAPEVDIKKLIGGAPAAEEDSAMKRYLALLEGREKSGAEQRKTDAYMALLSAGLGIMGGTSPFAAANIGQGAQAGVATQLAARKAQIADERATLAGYGSAAAAQEAAKERQARAAQGRESKIAGLISGREKQLEQLALNTVTKIGLNLDTAEGQARLAKEIQRLKSTDTLLPRLYQEYGLPPIQAVEPPDLVKSAEERLKQRGLK